MATSPDYRHVPTSTLARLAQRLGKVFVSATTWAKLIRERRWRHPRTRVHPATPKDDPSDAEGKSAKKKRPGRRQLSMEGLPIVEQRIVPLEVEACGGVGWVLVDEEVSERPAFRRARFECIRVVRESTSVHLQPGNL